MFLEEDVDLTDALKIHLAFRMYIYPDREEKRTVRCACFMASSEFSESPGGGVWIFILSIHMNEKGTWQQLFHISLCPHEHWCGVYNAGTWMCLLVICIQENILLVERSRTKNSFFCWIQSIPVWMLNFTMYIILLVMAGLTLIRPIDQLVQMNCSG